MPSSFFSAGICVSDGPWSPPEQKEMLREWMICAMEPEKNGEKCGFEIDYLKKGSIVCFQKQNDTASEGDSAARENGPASIGRNRPTTGRSILK